MGDPEIVEKRPDDPSQLVFPEVVAAMWKAPLPPPAAIKAYAETAPSYPERIMAMTERQIEMGAREQEHRHKIEMKEQDHRHRQEEFQNISIRNSVRRAQFGIIGIAVSGLVLAGALAWIGAHPALIGGSGIAGLLSPAFYALWGKMQSSKPQQDGN